MQNMPHWTAQRRPIAKEVALIKRLKRSLLVTDLGSVSRDALALGRRGDPGQRRAQVPLDIDREGLERRNVENPTAGLLFWRSREHQAVDGRQEGSQRLPRARRREQEGGSACQDRRPTKRLGARRGRERGLEPAPDGQVESGESWLGSLQRIRPCGVLRGFARTVRHNDASRFAQQVGQLCILRNTREVPRLNSQIIGSAVRSSRDAQRCCSAWFVIRGRKKGKCHARP